MTEPRIDECPDCGERCTFTVSDEPEELLYGADPETQVVLKLTVPVHTCSGCGFMYTDGAAELLRDHAVEQFLNTGKTDG